MATGARMHSTGATQQVAFGVARWMASSDRYRCRLARRQSALLQQAGPVAAYFGTRQYARRFARALYIVGADLPRVFALVHHHETELAGVRNAFQDDPSAGAI